MTGKRGYRGGFTTSRGHYTPIPLNYALYGIDEAQRERLKAKAPDLMTARSVIGPDRLKELEDLARRLGVDPVSYVSYEQWGLL
jgi:hypothetical protein